MGMKSHSRSPIGRGDPTNRRRPRGFARRWVAIGRRFSFVAIGLLIGLSMGVSMSPSARADAGEESHAPPRLRLISLNPSLTAIVIRLGAGETLVGVDEYSAELIEEVRGLPQVGGLFDPSLESVLALRPDRVLLVAGIDQQSHGQRLERLGLDVEIFENERLDQVLENIERLGTMLGRQAEATERIAAILGMRRAVADAVAGRARPATLAVVDRSPLFLVGGDTFIDEMLETVGAENLARTLGAGYPRGSIEWVIDAKPELLLDMTPGGVDGRAFWSRWPSLPAVSGDRVLTLDASRISLPGPELDRALRELAVAVHGPAMDHAIGRALETLTLSERPAQEASQP
jgi:iron complex transport system substrate-binding protein